MVSLLAPPLTTSESLSDSGAAHGDLRRQTLDDDRIAAGDNADMVVVGRPLVITVGRAIACAAAGRR